MGYQTPSSQFWYLQLKPKFLSLAFEGLSTLEPEDCGHSEPWFCFRFAWVQILAPPFSSWEMKASHLIFLYLSFLAYEDTSCERFDELTHLKCLKYSKNSTHVHYYFVNFSDLLVSLPTTSPFSLACLLILLFSLSCQPRLVFPSSNFWPQCCHRL